MIARPNAPNANWLSGLLALYAFFGAACTSIQWRDREGFDHHLGLFTYQISEHARGTTLSRTSLGIDVRLSGGDPGISIGLKKVEGTKPDVIVVTDPAALGDQIADYLKDPGSLLPRTEPRHGLFYLREKVSQEMALIETTNLGMEWVQGVSNPGLSVGLSTSSHYVGTTLRDDVVLIQLRDPISSETTHLVIWMLEP